ncbi:MAG: ABC transporter permease [Acidobacteria bacterium]|nr:ABC transporter permease [Acidobacteriota bacterium]
MRERIIQVVKKEFIQIRRDKKALRIILLAPLIQLMVFGYVATTDVKDIPLAVYDQSNSEASRTLVEKFTKSGYFSLRYRLYKYSDIDDYLDKGKIDAVLVIPTDYASNLKRGKTASIQLLLNGINSNTASIAANYASNIILNVSEKIILERLASSTGASQPVEIRDRVWFNPELKSSIYFVPGIIGFLLLLMLVPVTAMSIVREKETGTIEQLEITPLSSLELIIGKVIPFILIGYIDVTLVTFVGVTWFQVPVRGSLLLLYLFAGIFIIAGLSLGIFISSISNNMSQAYMGSIFFLMPNILLSGFIFPINSMPLVFQYLTYLIPMRYFLVIIRGIFLKGIGFWELWPQAVALILFILLVITISSRFVARSVSRD